MGAATTRSPSSRGTKRRRARAALPAAPGHQRGCRLRGGAPAGRRRRQQQRSPGAGAGGDGCGRKKPPPAAAAPCQPLSPREAATAFCGRGGALAVQHLSSDSVYFASPPHQPPEIKIRTYLVKSNNLASCFPHTQDVLGASPMQRQTAM